MKKRVVAACLAAVLGIAPCSVGASQESEVQCISESEISDILLETCTQELLETQEVSEETLQEIETVKQEIQSESEATVEQETQSESEAIVEQETQSESEAAVEQETQSESEVTVEQETQTEPEAATEQETNTESKAQSADEEKASEEIQTEPQTESQEQTQESILARKNMVNASPEGDGTYFNEYDENDLFWANQNGQGEVAISQVQLLRSMLAKVGKGYSQSLRYDANYYDCSSLILRCLQEFGLNRVPYSTYDWNNRLQGMKIGDVISFHGNGNYVSYKLTAINTDEISNPDAFLVPGTIIVLIAPGYSGGHVAVSLGSFARQDYGLDPVKDNVAIVNQTRNYVASQVAARYGADKSLLMGTNSITAYPNTWMDSNWLGNDIWTEDGYSGVYNRIWRLEAFNKETGVCVTNVARGTNGLTAKYVLVPVDTDTKLEEELSIDKIEISNVSSNGYQVNATFHATYGASRVLMPTWTEKGGQDDLIWHTAKVSGNTASFYVNTSAHNGEGGRYITHVYLYGQTGKYCVAASGANPPATEIKNYNGFHTETDGASYYYNHGKLANNYTGLVFDQGVWYYIREGKLDRNYAGLVFHAGSWYYVEKGCLNWNYTSLVRYNGRWFYVQNGYLDWRYTGLVEYYGTWYYVYKGELNWGYSGLVYDKGIWQLVRGGRLNKSYTGLVKHAGGWYYVNQGQVDWTYTGPVEYYGTTYYIQKGYLNWTYSASIELNGVTYQVKHGVVKKAL